MSTATVPDAPASLPHASPAASNSPVTASPTDRLHALDALRALAMFLGVVLHAALSFMTIDVPYTPRMDSSRSAAFDILVFGIHAFRMQTFFVVAGYFAAMLLARRTPGAFLANRALRIGLPLLVGAFTIVPLTMAPFFPAHGSSLDTVPFWRFMSAPAHLWFLIYLAVFCLAAALWTTLAERRARGGGGLLARAVASPFAVPLMLVPTVLLNLTMPSWSIETAWGWLPRPASLAYYGLFFAAGFALHRAGAIADVGRGWRWMLPVALLVLLPLLIWLSTRTPPIFGYAPLPEFLGQRVGLLPIVIVQAALTWTMVCSLIGLFMSCCNNPRPWVRWLADSSYWVYLVHLPIVYFLAFSLSRWTIPGLPTGPLAAFIKFAIILTVTSAFCLITYALFIRPTPLERIIGGSGKKARSLNDIPAAPPSRA